MLKFNCNHFTDEFLTLLLGRGLPNFVNRAAYIGSFAHCLVPHRYLIVIPPGAAEDEIQMKVFNKWDVVTEEKSIMDEDLDETNFTQENE